MAAEKLESWEFSLSRKPSRTGWDVTTTRTGYGYENCKANVLMDYKGWFIVCSKEGQVTRGCTRSIWTGFTRRRPAGNLSSHLASDQD